MKKNTKKAKAKKPTNLSTTPVEVDSDLAISYCGNQEWIAAELAAGGKFSWIS